MMHPNEFDGNAAFSGGGFMPSQATQAADHFSFSFSKNSDARCLIPVTVKQLKDLSRNGESGISIDGVDVNTVVLVGIVCKIDNAVTDYTFRVDDGTGWIDCTKWVHEHVESAEVEAISVGKYVRVHGQLKSIQSRKTLNTFSIRPLTDFNQITSHFLECIYVHLYNTKLRGTTTQPQMTNSTISNAPINQFSGQYSSEDEQIIRISPMVSSYLQHPARCASDTGARSDIIARDLNIPLDKIRKVLEYLQSEGLIYTTIDDHFKLTTA
ncbi:hypothetical protein SLEP1_g13141 [Rubroshorea leprosula]|uniref:Replication protein A C-terminal domain-containing protein n=1 Tax=Rubroshorea leprosula TaxID=152421 RepID=A0AAV5IEU4_9ROSI|nr:hypothetical protein SLEP1_g13141 [Rubroshorea leprosula]